MSDIEQARTIRYAFITNRALRAIWCVRDGHGVTTSQAEALGLAGDLLLEMRRGAEVLGNSKQELGFSADSYPAATRAFGIIAELSLASQMKEVHVLLERFENFLRNASVGRVEDPQGKLLNNLERFLGALNQRLTDEVSAATFGSEFDGVGSADF